MERLKSFKNNLNNQLKLIFNNKVFEKQKLSDKSWAMFDIVLYENQ